MTETLRTFGYTDMPQELTNWQTEDMHRKYPETRTEQLRTKDEVSALTDIFPRSRTYEETHPHRVHPVKKPTRPLPVLRHTTMQHPILRPMLFDKLYSRMVALLDEKIKWQSTSL